VLTAPFIGRGGEPRGQGRVKRRPSMASMADGFKTLKWRGNGVTAVPIQGGVKAMGQRFKSSLHGTRRRATTV
jgi:hypothetical protein